MSVVNVASPARSQPRTRRRGGVEKAKARAGWLLLAPALIHSAIFIALPAIIVVMLSFTDARVIGGGSWVGLSNYADLLDDPLFRESVQHTLVYTVAVIPLAMAIAILVAVGLSQNIRGRAVFRTLFYIPVVTSTVAVASVWLWIYNPSSGLGNEVLAFLGISPSGWLTDPDTALPALTAIGIWQGLGAKMCSTWPPCRASPPS